VNFDFNRGPTRRRAFLWAALASAAFLTAGCGTGGLQAGAADKGNGKQLFVEKCGSCHTLADAGAAGQVGPNLDKVLAGKPPAFIKASILTPDAEVAPGFGKGIMPANYKDTLSPAEVSALAAYLAKVTQK